MQATKRNYEFIFTKVIFNLES